MVGKKMKRWVSAVVTAMMLYGLIAGVFAPQAEASTARIAKIISVTGDAQVTKSGGKKPYKAFKGLYLNQGDHITTGSKSSMIVEVEDRKDEVTIGSNSELYVSQLKEDDGSKNTSFKVWSGSMWTKASSLVDTKDTFEVETPTAVMGVRGTQFLIAVNPITGETGMFVSAGIVNAKKPAPTGDAPDEDPIAVYPSMQAYLVIDSDTGEIDSAVGYIDPADLVRTTDASIIEAIIRNKQQMDQEHEEYLRQLRQGTDAQPPGMDVSQEEQLRNYEELLNHMVNHLVKNALDQRRISEQDIQNMLDQILTDYNRRVELDLNPPEPKLTEEQRRMQQDLEEKRKRQQEQQERKQQEQEQKRQQQAELVERLKQQQEEQQRRNKEAAEQKRQEAEQRLLDQLNEEQRQRFEQQRQQRDNSQPAPSTPSSGGGSSSPSRPTGSELNGIGTYTGSVTATVHSGSVTYGPVTGTRTIVGDVTLNGRTSGEIALRNLDVQGNLIVNAGQASVLLHDTVQVTGKTIVQDVSPHTLTSRAKHGDKVDIQDSNGTRLWLSGTGSKARVEITGGGEVALAGEYQELVQVKSDAHLFIEPDTVVQELEVLHSAMQLSNEGWIGEIVAPSDLELHASVLQVMEQIIERKITAVNEAETMEAMQAALQALGLAHEMSDAAIAYLLQLRPAGGFTTYEQLMEAVEQAIMEFSTRPALSLAEPISSVPVGEPIHASSSKQGSIYLVPAPVEYISQPLFDEYVQSNLAVKAAVGQANAHVTLDTSRLLPGEYELYAFDAQGMVSSPIAIFILPSSEDDPYVVYHGSSPATDRSTIKIGVERATTIYIVDRYYMYSSDSITASDLERMVSNGDAIKYPVLFHQPELYVNISHFTQYGESVSLLVYAVNEVNEDRVSPPTREIWIPAEDSTLGTITGTVTLSEPAPVGGMRVLVFSKYAYDYIPELVPIEDESTLLHESYTYVNIGEGQTSANYSLLVEPYFGQKVGYSILTELPEGSRWIKQAYFGEDSRMVSYLADAWDLSFNEQNDYANEANLTIASGIPVTGTVQVHPDKLGGSKVVFVLAENEQGQAGYTTVDISGTSPEPFTVIAPEGERYKFQYFMIEEYQADNVFYYGQGGNYTSDPNQAAWLNRGVSANLVLPADTITNIKPFDITKYEFAFTWDKVDGVDGYEFWMFDEHGYRYNFSPWGMTADEAEANHYTVYAEGLESQRGSGLSPNRTYYVVVTTYGMQGNEPNARGIGIMKTGEVLYAKPYVVGTTPVANAMAVPLNSSMDFIFNEPVLVHDLTGFVLLDGYDEVVENVQLHASSSNKIVTVSFDQELQPGELYTLRLLPNAVRSLNDVGTRPFELPFRSASTDVEVPTVTSVVYEDRMYVQWGAPVLPATHYEVWVNGKELEPFVEGTEIELEGHYGAGDLAILVRAYDNQQVVAETEIYPAFPEVPYFNVIAGNFDVEILYFDFDEVAGAARYVVYNNESQASVMTGPTQVQVNYPGEVMIAAFDEEDRIIARSKVHYELDLSGMRP